MRLVESVGDKYRLSPELIRIAGPFWGNSWEIHKFVCHLISHFDDSLEHLLDDSDGETPELFDVSLEYCELLAQKYSGEFLPLPAEWYKRLYRAKLEALDVPEDLIRVARFSFLTSTYDHRLTSESLQRLMANQARHVPATYEKKLQEAARSEPETGWEFVEEVVESLIAGGVILVDDMRGWMDVLLAEQDYT